MPSTVDHVRAHAAIALEVSAFAVKVNVEIGNQRREAVGVLDLVYRSVPFCNLQAVRAHGRRRAIPQRSLSDASSSSRRRRHRRSHWRIRPAAEKRSTSQRGSPAFSFTTCAPSMRNGSLCQAPTIASISAAVMRPFIIWPLPSYIFIWRAPSSRRRCGCLRPNCPSRIFEAAITSRISPVSFNVSSGWCGI